jgi:hypothetical protein
MLSGKSSVLFHYLKLGRGNLTYGALLGSSLSLVNITANSTNEFHNLSPLKLNN